MADKSFCYSQSSVYCHAALFTGQSVATSLYHWLQGDRYPVLFNQTQGQLTLHMQSNRRRERAIHNTVMDPKTKVARYTLEHGNKAAVPNFSCEPTHIFKNMPEAKC